MGHQLIEDVRARLFIVKWPGVITQLVYDFPSFDPIAIMSLPDTYFMH